MSAWNAGDWTAAGTLALAGVTVVQGGLTAILARAGWKRDDRLRNQETQRDVQRLLALDERQQQQKLDSLAHSVRADVVAESSLEGRSGMDGAIAVQWPDEYHPRQLHAEAFSPYVDGQVSFGHPGERDKPNLWVQSFDEQTRSTHPRWAVTWVAPDDQKWATLDGQITDKMRAGENLFDTARRLDLKLRSGGRED